jgi:cation diffusion facilitator CzcD-associated flavoprotein CzcO
VDKHFTPKYRPWQQRLAFVPDGDLFQGISRRQGHDGHRRDRALHRRGILLKSGDELTADVIITATGFNLSVLGDIEFSIDGQPVDFSRHRHLSRDDVHRRAQPAGSSATSVPAGRCAPT